ncbi:MAG: hypothetical protein N3A72_11680 [bacterium]|nr:hypothetical protein [bacterium]
MTEKLMRKRELVCPHTDCMYYSAEQTLVEGEWILISYCSNPNSDLIDKGTSCRLYHVNWQKQINKNGNGLTESIRTNDIEKVRRRRITLTKMLRWTVNQLDSEERDIIFDLLNEIKQREEQILQARTTSTTPTGTPVVPEEETVTHPKLQKSEPEFYPNEVQEEQSAADELTAFSFIEQLVASRQREKGFEPVQEPQAESPSLTRDVHSPEAVIEKFITCWNTQDFETEYNLLSKRLQTVPKNEYIISRQHAFADAMKNQNNGNIPKQKLVEISSKKIEDNFAYIECVKSEQSGRFEKLYQQTYSLVKENGDWKISKVRTSPIPKMRR